MCDLYTFASTQHWESHVAILIIDLSDCGSA